VAPGEAGLAFFRMARECYDAIAVDSAITSFFPKDLRAWWGDQYALASMVGYDAYAERTTEAMSLGGVRVRFFPCETHNFTMDSGSISIEELRRKFFIHFKGNRKQLQAQYLDALRAGRV
ncbi:MAG TPA: hypothetical protein VN878_08560, partial [Usitatibacter sp.]|nr:hypothetical protein [Usitatibacter sp.]